MRLLAAAVLALVLVSCKSGTPSSSTVKENEGDTTVAGATDSSTDARAFDPAVQANGEAISAATATEEAEKRVQAKIYNYTREDVLVTTPTHPEGEVLKPYKGLDFTISSKTKQNGTYVFTARALASNQSTDLNVPADQIEGGGWGAAVQLVDGQLMIRQNRSGAAQGGAGPSGPITPR